MIHTQISLSLSALHTQTFPLSLDLLSDQLIGRWPVLQPAAVPSASLKHLLLLPLTEERPATTTAVVTVAW
ncbi:hypothetical protein Hanom_Chr17g01563031 [Helianthus anomalus]